MVGVLVDDVKERICSCSFSKGIVSFAYQGLRELKGTNIMGCEGFVRQGVIIIDKDIGDRKVLARGYMV